MERKKKKTLHGQRMLDKLQLLSNRVFTPSHYFVWSVMNVHTNIYKKKMFSCKKNYLRFTWANPFSTTHSRWRKTRVNYNELNWRWILYPSKWMLRPRMWLTQPWKKPWSMEERQTCQKWKKGSIPGNTVTPQCHSCPSQRGINRNTLEFSTTDI